MDPSDAGRLSVANCAVVRVMGTMQMEPSVDENGQPDGLARNAGMLRLAAGVNVVMLVAN
ncbi:MAG TPA: hypothetical protein VNK04_05240 [Gemmataceae bacterium]|nr:hypothetical protein [Gemmataceae bacterium]